MMLTEKEIDERIEICRAASERPWRWSPRFRGRPNQFDVIVVPIPNCDYGSKRIVLSEDYTEQNGKIYDSWLRIKPEDAALVIDSVNNREGELLELKAALQEVERYKGALAELKARRNLPRADHGVNDVAFDDVCRRHGIDPEEL